MFFNPLQLSKYYEAKEPNVNLVILKKKQKNIYRIGNDPQPTTIVYPCDSSEFSDLKIYWKAIFVIPKKGLSPSPIAVNFIYKKVHY